MPKLALVTLAIGEDHQKIGKLTHPLMQAYAEKIGAEFICISHQKVYETTPHWEKFRIYELLNNYDRILYLDTDIIIRDHAPNIFDIIPDTHLGILNEQPFVEDRTYAFMQGCQAYGYTDMPWDKIYFNTGVMVISKIHQLLFVKPNLEASNFFEQTYLNLQIKKQKIPVSMLDYKWNRMFCIDKFIGVERFEAYFIHYAGVGSPERVLTIIQEDLERIAKLPPDYIAPKYIWLSVQGGLGDQVQAEPTIRFAMNHVWPGADIRLHTHFPELFAHLPLPIKKHEENLWEGVTTQPFTRTTLPTPDMIQYHVVSNMMCHTVDFCSIAVLARTLPDKDKTYQLKVDSMAGVNICTRFAFQEFNNCVLIHAGRHWQSKTFPTEWWQEVVDGLIEKGLIPVFVGQDSETRGVIKLETREVAIDLTNKISLSELIAIISLIPALISNDSAPIHIAGAFDNWIFLIPSIKHPDHLLPWRNGTKHYKAISMCKKLALDDLCTSTAEIGQHTADNLTRPWSEYLPETKDVIEKVAEVYSKI